MAENSSSLETLILSVHKRAGDLIVPKFREDAQCVLMGCSKSKPRFALPEIEILVGGRSAPKYPQVFE